MVRTIHACRDWARSRMYVGSSNVSYRVRPNSIDSKTHIKALLNDWQFPLVDIEALKYC